MSKQDKVLSGMRPSGKLHLGHYHGVLSNWLELQKTSDCYFFVADWHALTTEYKDTSQIKEHVFDMVVDWLASGIDPEQSVIFTQSDIKEHAELFVILSMITPLGWLERNPTYKDQVQALKDKEIQNFGFLGYPVLQTADIIMYKANKVPVGEDQVPHVELSREITRRFNGYYKNIFPEPEAILTKEKKFLGTDGRKMSKSYNNSVFLSDDAKTVEKKLKTMVTDTRRQRKTDAGVPSDCPFFISYHLLYSDSDTIKEVEEGCTGAKFGCVDCKMKVIPKVIASMTPMWDKRESLLKDKNTVYDIINEGNKKARQEAQKTMAEVRQAMKLDY